MDASHYMRALIFHEPNHMELEDVPRPTPGPGEVLINIYTATICGTDVRILNGSKTRDVRRGHPIGHECSGLVAAIGPDITDFKMGDPVAVHPVVSCGHCTFCTHDRENLCEERITLGYHTDGAFAEAMLIPAHAVERDNVYVLPPEVPLENASLLEPAACCINGQHEMGLGSPEAGPEYTPAESLLIIGAGPIGLLHLLLARARQACSGPIAVVEPKVHRRELAITLGADMVFAPEQFNVAGAFDAVILAAGVPEMVEVALRAARKAGRVNLFASFDADSRVAIDANSIHYKQLRITGASESRGRDYGEALALAVQGLDLSRLITNRFGLEDYESAFRLAADRSALKIAFSIAPA